MYSFCIEKTIKKKNFAIIMDSHRIFALYQYGYDNTRVENLNKKSKLKCDIYRYDTKSVDAGVTVCS